jgi:cytochrome c-type protein NapC/trimethylamine-N-oxide reductase cytochrome c-type subunit TorC
MGLRQVIKNTVGSYGVPFVLGVVFAVGCYLGISRAAKPFSGSEYCGGKCHEMAEAYNSWELSAHGTNANAVTVECVDCHLPAKDKFFSHMTAKTYAGGKDLYMHHFGGEYSVEKMRTKVLEEMPDSRCARCHGNLLEASGTAIGRKAHIENMTASNDATQRCVECHDDIHQRESKIFSLE